MTTTPPHPSPLSAPDDPVRLTLRTPEDALAAVPVVLGFEPHDSIAMLTFGGRETFHARVDVPPPEELDEAARLLVEPARRHGVQSVLLVVYSGDGWAALAAQRRLQVAFRAAGIVVVEVLRADGARWWSLLHASPHEGVPYDAFTHPFRAESVLAGKVVHGSREELSALLDAVAGAVEPVTRALRRAVPMSAEELSARLPGRLSGPCEVPRSGAVVAPMPSSEVARLLLALEDLELRDVAWTGIDRAGADQHVRFWTDVVQRSPEDFVAGSASVLAVAAWLAGHGALAWCAVDRAQAVDPHNSLARLVADLLTQAVPPQVWDETRSVLGLGLDPADRPASDR